MIVILLILSVSCKNRPTESKDNFDWMLGSWIRTNEQENRLTFENWEKHSDSEYTGFGFTLENNDTIWQENIKLIKKDGEWSFDVTGQGESNSTNFKLIRIEEQCFVCENQLNEFPKIIEYSKNGDLLKATISGNNMKVDFDFEEYRP
ncbi:DUF6265 family protein [Carboxylicivirga caseinilyticus]|uniref:DUF6265 family protein n=1 Tax=Carboxylicivirga caseinilyticus TaxID=3417572 RepID=UPI003D332446|nr:hypothetical protein [Marinilabiliaceae bacterium A049]